MEKQLGLDEAFALGEMDTFYKRTVEKVKMTVRGQKFAGMEIDDVVQETLIKVHRAMPKYDNTKSKVGTYVDSIIRNMVKDCFKRASSQSNLCVVNAQPIDGPSSVNEQTMDNAGDDICFQVGVTDSSYYVFEVVTDLLENLGLTDREKEVFKLRAAGYENFEIAQILGITRSRITQIWSKIMDKYESAD